MQHSKKEFEVKTVEDAFALAHADICYKKFKKGRNKNPASRRHCGRQLYRFLQKYGLELDPAYNHKKRSD